LNYADDNNCSSIAQYSPISSVKSNVAATPQSTNDDNHQLIQPLINNIPSHIPCTTVSTPPLLPAKKKLKTKISTRKVPKKQTKRPASPPVGLFKSYDDEDNVLNNIIPFAPSRDPGSQLNRNQLRTKSKAIDFFNLFFDDDVIDKITKHTNEYAQMTIVNKSSYGDKDGAWIETTASEIRALIALMIYQGLVRVSCLKNYWSTRSLYHGLWARSMLSRNLVSRKS